MKKFAIAAIAAVVATVSLSSVAEARRRHHDEFGSRHIEFVEFEDFRLRCSTMKIVKIGRHGKKSVTIIKKCR